MAEGFSHGIKQPLNEDVGIQIGAGQLGHELGREIIRKHVRDRYPTAQLNTMKLAGEVGELVEAVLKHITQHAHIAGKDAYYECSDIRKEYGDVGLTLYNLGNRLGLNLIECMKEVVDAETRRFD